MDDKTMLERDAARFRHLQSIDPKRAQAFFWHYQSRKQRAQAIDAEIGKGMGVG